MNVRLCLVGSRCGKPTCQGRRSRVASAQRLQYGHTSQTRLLRAGFILGFDKLLSLTGLLSDELAILKLAGCSQSVHAF